MKMRFLYKPAVPLLVAAFFALAACNDPIFFTIGQEVAPIEPLIKGGPTNFVVFQNFVYVASGSTLYRYAGGDWSRTGVFPPPGGRINSLAVDSNYLYALCYTTDTTSIIRRFDGYSWEDISNTTGYNVRHIYDANNTVFISAEKSNLFAVFYVDGSSIKLIDGIPVDDLGSQLCGVAYDRSGYYLCTMATTNSSLSTKANGIYYGTTLPNVTPITDTSGKYFTGIISIDNDTGSGSTIVAIDRGALNFPAKLYTVTSSSITEVYSLEKYSTRALAIWKGPNGSRLLLAAQTDPASWAAYSNGYMELTLDANGTPASGFREPGTDSPSSVVDGNNERYKASIGRLPVNYMIQAPSHVDSEMRLFASTQSGGVWSYRIRNGVYQWNAED